VPTSIKGTFNYMAPEAFEPPLGVEADVWSMACMVLEMSTGQPPWAGLQMQQIMMAVGVRKRVPEVPDSVPGAEAVRRCTLRHPG
jgi:serine/threonine protein kinase